MLKAFQWLNFSHSSSKGGSPPFYFSQTWQQSREGCNLNTRKHHKLFLNIYKIKALYLCIFWFLIVFTLFLFRLKWAPKSSPFSPCIFLNEYSRLNRNTTNCKQMLVHCNIYFIQWYLFYYNTFTMLFSLYLYSIDSNSRFNGLLQPTICLKSK